MKTIKIQGLLLLLILMTVTGEIRGADGITTIPYYMDFSSGTEPFDGGSVVSGTNVAGVFRVTNSTATASFVNTHTLNSNETVKVAFTAYHGYLNNNSTSSVQIVNTDGVVLAGYTYNHTLGQIVDVTIGGVMATNFTVAFDAASYVNDTQRANGLVGGDSGKPYLDNDNYSPNITMSVKGDGTATLTVWIGSKSSWNAFYGSLTGLKLDLASLRIVSNCNNDDRTICIDKLNISSNCYNENYDSGNIDWTTGTGDRYTPVVLEESGNRYLSVNQEQRDNNGATLTSNNLGMVAGSCYRMTFDLKLGSSNNQSPTSFTVHDATDTGTIFSLTATGVSIDTWYVNGTNTMVTLPGSNSYQTPLSNITWVSVTILRNGMTTWISIKNRETNADILTATAMTASSTGGLGTMQFVSSRYYANFAIDNVYVQPILDWSVAVTTVNIRDVGSTNPNTIAGLPYIHLNSSAVSNFTSSDTNVAYVSGTGTSAKVIIKGVGTTTLTAMDANSYSATTTLTVTGDQHNPTANAENNTLSFADRGYIVNNTSGTGYSHTLSTGLQIDFGYNGETALIVQNGSYNVLKIIDSNGYSHPNLYNNVVVPWEGQYGGTFVKLTPLNSGYLTVVGNVSVANTKLYRSDNVLVETDINEENHTLVATLTGGSVYYLYNKQTTEEETSGTHTSLVHSISFSNPLFVSSTAVIEIPADGNYPIPTVGSLTPTLYELTKYGDLSGSSLSVSGGVLTGIDKSGAVLIKLSDGSNVAYHLVTVAYKATDYPGKMWDFNIAGEAMTTSNNLKEVPTPTTTITDDNHNSWTARYKNVHVDRAPEWRLNRPVNGDNVVILPETAGLLFNTGNQGFYLRNDNSSFKHIGIYNYNASFTIPFLKTGDIVELNWKHDASNSGSFFYATNLTDLRYKTVCPNPDDTFEITESAFRTNDNHPGRYSFIVANNGDVTFTLKDWGYTDILSVRIYKGPYHSTMRNINLSGNTAAPTTMLLDNAQQGYTYNYCNQLNSTATGPAMYVLKGYRKNNGGTIGVDYDHEGCVKGSNASKSPEFFIDEDAYPVSDEEKTRLYELRKNIVGLQMYNDTWQSSNNSYNNGVIKATSGWGKITIRMNNYTNDMKYVIGYTPDYTLTIGSAPHQTYPYTWDFTKMAGQEVTRCPDNVLYSIEAEGSNPNFSGMAPTNWFKNGNGQFTLNTDNSGDMGSQYVPGAVLVTQDRALSNFNGVDYDAKWAKDELDGLGFDGDFTMHIDHLPSDVTSGWNRAPVADIRNSMLSFKITDYAVFNQTGETEDEPIGTWSFPTTEQEAGAGMIQLNEHCQIHESSIPAGGIGYQLDGGVTKYIYIRLTSNLQPGDIISITGYNIYNQNTGVSIYDKRTDQGGNLLRTIDFNGKYAEETVNYTVVDNQGLDGKNEFYLYRKGDATIHITAIEITRSASTMPDLDWSIYTLTNTTITVPDLNADGKQDWIYVSSTVKPLSVTNATEVTEGTDGPDANTNVYKYKVMDEGNAYLTFAAGTKIYKIGVTHILKEIHPVGGVGWATESRNHHIDHSLIGYFTKNDVNAYTVRYDSYDMKTATVALTPVNEDGYVPQETGIVMKLDNIGNLNDANSGKYVPLFYPSYTLGASSTSTTFSPTGNLMYPNLTEATHAYENAWPSGGTYTKFILTNKYWTFNKDNALNTDESAESHTADAAGFYRMHIWKTTADASDKNTMAANTAYLLVPSDNLPVAVWTLQSGYSAARGDLLGVYNIIGPGSETAIGDVRLTPEFMANDYNTDGEETWYTVSGMKLSTRPTKPGLYIYNNRKVVIK